MPSKSWGRTQIVLAAESPEKRLCALPAVKSGFVTTETAFQSKPFRERDNMLPTAELRKSTRKVIKTIEVDEEVIEGVTLHLSHDQAKLLHLLTGSVHGEGSLGIWKSLENVLGNQGREYAKQGETYNGDTVYSKNNTFILTSNNTGSPGIWRRKNVQ